MQVVGWQRLFRGVCPVFRTITYTLMCLHVVCSLASRAWAGGPVCVVSVEVDTFGRIYTLHDAPGEGVLVGSSEGLFHYDGSRITSLMKAGPMNWVDIIHDAPSGGVLVGSNEGLF